MERLSDGGIWEWWTKGVKLNVLSPLLSSLESRDEVARMATRISEGGVEGRGIALAKEV